MSPTVWMKKATSAPLGAIVALIDATRAGGSDSRDMRRRIATAVQSLRCDREAEASGLNHHHVDLARRAFYALADEISRRPGSLCDYSSDTTLLQQEFMHTENAGELFFSDLNRILKDGQGDDCYRAVAYVYSLCLSLGFRGIYTGHDLAGYERVTADTRAFCEAMLHPPSDPPQPPALRWKVPRRRHIRPIVVVCASLLLSASVALLVLQRRLRTEATSVASALPQLTDTDTPTSRN